MSFKPAGAALIVLLIVSAPAFAANCSDFLSKLPSLIDGTVQAAGFQITETSPALVSRFPFRGQDQLQGSRFDHIREFLSKGKILRQELNAPSQNALNKTTSVIYPAAGTDAIFPYVLFPNAPLVIAIDNHAFATSKQDGFRFAATEDSLGWRQFQDIGDSRSMGSAILSNLSMAVPGFRLQSVRLFGPPKNGPRRNAIVKFDQGVGTPAQFFVFISDEAPKVGPQWWYPLISEDFGVIIKGGMKFPLKAFWNFLHANVAATSALAVGSSTEIGGTFDRADGVNTFGTSNVLVGYFMPGSTQTLLYHWQKPQ